MCSAIEAIISTAATGWAPIAVSWESMIASVPSRIALATSVTSARVGREETTIESSIWVAVMAGRASEPASASTRFCTSGTSSMRISIPRSPRATITQSDDVQDLLAALHRRGLLDLGDQRAARVAAHLGDVLGTAHERQRHHVHADRLAEAQQLQVALGHGGQRRPARRGCSGPAARPPRRRPRSCTSTSQSASRTAVMRRRTAPSARYSTSPAWPDAAAAASPSQGTGQARARRRARRCRTPASGRSPGLSSATSSRTGPIRSLGPGRSCRIATWRPAR